MTKDKEIAIVSPIKDSPAQKAGIKPGDIIRKVDNFDTKDKTLYETVNKIKGKKGTKVKLTLERNGKTIVIDVIRGKITIKPLEYKIVGNGDIMHIKVITFNEGSAEGFRNVIQIIKKNPNIKGIILDFRNNPGGLLSVATEMLNYILPKGSVAVQIQYSYFNVFQKTVGEEKFKDYPMAVLVNKGSASASEIVAGALKDYGRAKIIGETTFGKGTVQEINYFQDKSSLKLTIAKWLTPKGNTIDGKGITPDIKITKGANGADTQLNRAVYEVNKYIK